MSQKERNEWIERAKERVLRNAKETDTYARDIMDLYDETANQLENNQLDVDELSGKVKRVSELIAFCKSKLHETEEEVEKILKTIED